MALQAADKIYSIRNARIAAMTTGERRFAVKADGDGKLFGFFTIQMHSVSEQIE